MKYANLTVFVGLVTWCLVVVSAVFLIEEQTHFDYLAQQEVTLSVQKKAIPKIVSHRFTSDQLRDAVEGVQALYPDLTFDVKPLGYIEVMAEKDEDLFSFKEAVSMLSYRNENVASKLDGFCFGDACLNGVRVWGKISLFDVKVQKR